MNYQRRFNDSVNWYMSELTSRIVAESGIPSDQFHLGKIVLQSLKDAPGHVLQIDGATGELETNGSVLERSVRCAAAFRKLGVKLNDVIILMAPSHLDLTIPYYASLFLGVAIGPIDRTLTVQELRDIFVVDKPKIIFCQSEKALDVGTALKGLHLDTHIVTFDDHGDVKNISSPILYFQELLNKGNDATVENFKVTGFDPEETLALLIATSGSTGLPKQAAATHKNLTITGVGVWRRHHAPTPTRLVLILSPLQWVSALFHFNMGPIMKYTRLQTSGEITQEHSRYLINKYKPTYTLVSPTFLTSLVNQGVNCDFTCFETINVGGSAVSAELIDEIKLVDVEKNIDINEPNVSGELWIKGPGVAKGYYNNPEASRESFVDGGWYKTGDAFYRDENWNFYFVERLKMLLKYKNHQVSPVEVENVIRKHPGVLDVAVSGIPDQELGDLIVACVVRNDGSDVTAQEIKDLVKDSLTDTKQLRGGVIILKEMPLTANGKVHTRRIKEIVCEMERE